MKKILLFILFILSFVLASCGWKNNISNISLQSEQVNLSSISTWNINWILVWVTDPHVYSKQGPLLVSWSYYFNPYNFYRFNKNLLTFMKAYSSNFDDKKVYYYDENDWAQAWIVVYVLRNVYNKENVSLWLNSKIDNLLKTWLSLIPVNNTLTNKVQANTGWYIWIGKYLVVYDPTKINFQTGDLLLYSSDIWTMKQDSFYKNSIWVNIKSFYWSNLIDIMWWLKSKSKIDKLIKSLQLEKYKRVFIYYPKAWYRSWVLALYLQENY